MASGELADSPSKSVKTFARKIQSKVRTTSQMEMNAELMRNIKLLKQGSPAGGGDAPSDSSGLKRKVKVEEEKRKRSRIDDQKPIKVEEDEEDDASEEEPNSESDSEDDQDQDQEDEDEDDDHEEEEDEKPLKLKEIHHHQQKPKAQQPAPQKRARRKIKENKKLAMVVVKNLRNTKKVAGTRKRKKDFSFFRTERDAKLAGFMYRKMWHVEVPALSEPRGVRVLQQLGLLDFSRLQPPHLDKKLCDEFLSTFEPKSACALVSGRVIRLDMESVSRAVKLPLGIEPVPNYTSSSEQLSSLKRLLVDSCDKTCRGFNIGQLNYWQDDLHAFQAIAALLMVKMEVRKECFQFVSPEVLLGLDRSLRLGVVLNWAEYLAGNMVRAAGSVNRKELSSLAYQYGEWLTLVIQDHLEAPEDQEKKLTQIVPVDARLPDSILDGGDAREDSLEKQYERLGKEDEEQADSLGDDQFRIREVSKIVGRLRKREAKPNGAVDGTPGVRTRSRSQGLLTPKLEVGEEVRVETKVSHRVNRVQELRGRKREGDGDGPEFHKQALREMEDENAELRMALAQVQGQVDMLEKSRAEAVEIITSTSTAYLELKKQYKASQMLMQVQGAS